MIESTFIQFVKRNNLRLIFFILLGLFMSENGFARFNWIRDYVRVIWTDRGGGIVITATVHHYSYENFYEHGYLDNCIFEASDDNINYFKLMEINTPKPDMSEITQIYFKNKFENALLSFTDNVITPGVGSVWPEYLKSKLKVQVHDSRHLAVVGIGWKLKSEFSGVSYIRIFGKWSISGLPSLFFKRIIYSKANQNALKSNIPYTITEGENDAVDILKDSEAIVIKGADPGANIKVYLTSGHEIKSLISDNDVVMIKLPSKQIYIVHLGNSRYKIAL